MIEDKLLRQREWVPLLVVRALVSDTYHAQRYYHDVNAAIDWLVNNDRILHRKAITGGRSRSEYCHKSVIPELPDDHRRLPMDPKEKVLRVLRRNPDWSEWTVHHRVAYYAHMYADTTKGALDDLLAEGIIEKRIVKTAKRPRVEYRIKPDRPDEPDAFDKYTKERISEISEKVEVERKLAKLVKEEFFRDLHEGRLSWKKP